MNNKFVIVISVRTESESTHYGPGYPYTDIVA